MKAIISDPEYWVKVKKVENILIPHRHFLLALNRVQRIVERARNGAEPRHILLVGESGAGKTWLAHYIKSIHQSDELCESMAVLLVSTPASPTLKNLSEAILMELGDPLAHRGTAFDKGKRAISLLRKRRVEFIVLDEFHQFVDHAKHDSIMTVSDWLKRFIDEAQVPVMLIGLPRCQSILQVNEQLRRRFSSRLELPPFSIDTEEAEIEFRAILKEIDKSLPAQRISGLAEPDIARRLYFACNGLIGYLRALITETFELMIISGRIKLDIDLFEQAFTDCIWKDGVHALNPFNSKFQFRPLNRIGEPYHPSSKLFLRDQGRKQ